MEKRFRKTLHVVGCALVACALVLSVAPASQAHAATKPAKVKSVKVSQVKTTSAKVKWKKASSKSVKGYQVRVYKGKKVAKKYTVKKRTTVSKKVTGLKANTKYTVKVRAYKGSKHKVYGKWSSAKKFITKKKTTVTKPTTSTTNTSNSNSNSNSNASSGQNDATTHLHVWQRSKTHNEPWYTEYLANHSSVEHVSVKVKRYEITETQYDCLFCKSLGEEHWQNVGAGHFWNEHQSTVKQALDAGQADSHEVTLQEAGEELVTDNPQTVIECECGKELVCYSYCHSCGEYLSTACDSGEHSYEEHYKLHPSITAAASSVNIER